MSHVLRSTVHVAATFAAAAAVSRVADSARRLLDEIAVDPAAEADASLSVRPEPGPVQRLAVARAPSLHPFNPVPSVPRVVGFEPERAVPKARVEEKAKPTVSLPEAPAVVESIVPEAPHDEPELAEPKPEEQPRRITGAVSGSVTNVHGRGLRGLRVEVVDADKTVVGSATTTGGGLFTVDGVPPGTYRLRAFDDVEGDFEKSWFGGPKYRSAGSFTVTAASTVKGIDVELRSTAQIDVGATGGKRKIDVVVTVTNRATGAPATGEVELSTKQSEHVSVALVDGQAPISLTDVGKGAVKKVRVFYSGDRQTRPASTRAKVR